MKKILKKSEGVIRVWNVTLVLFLISLILGIFFIVELKKNYLDIESIPPWIFVLIFVFLISLLISLICWIIGFIKEIIIFFELKRKYDLLLLKKRDSVNRYEFKIVSTLKNTILLIIILELLFWLISLYFKHSYKKKIKGIKEDGVWEDT